MRIAITTAGFMAAMLVAGAEASPRLHEPTRDPTGMALFQQGNGQGQGRAQGSGKQQGGGAARAQSGARGRPQASSGEGRGSARGRAQAGGGGNGRAQDRPRAGGRDSEGRPSNRGNGGEARRSEVARGRSENASAARSGSRGASGVAVARRSDRAAERMLTSAVSRGHGRGVAPNAFRTSTEGGRVRVLNQRGALLVDMDDDRAREMGAWRLRRMGDRQPTGNAPAFCRSGEGHPVWGRDWCLEKGFGLGSRSGTLWSRGTIDDVVFRAYPPRLDRPDLVSVLGDIVFGRMALQAVSLGYDQPLAGVWLAPSTGPRILQVHSGGYPVAEFVDVDRDDRPEVLYVIQPL